MRLVQFLLCSSLLLLVVSAHDACTSIRGASACSMLQHSISEKLNVKELDASADRFFKQLDGLSLPSPLCDRVFRATICNVLMPSCNATEFAVGDYRHQKPCKFLELYLKQNCSLVLPLGDLTFGEAPDCFVPNIVEQPACASSETPPPSSPPKTTAPPKVPKQKASKTPKVNFAHLVQDWEVAASLVEDDVVGQQQNDKAAEARPAAHSKSSSSKPVEKDASASSSCANPGALQSGALIEVAGALDTLGAAEHAHFVYLQALHASSAARQPTSIDTVR
jgi:hypothetical protein